MYITNFEGDPLSREVDNHMNFPELGKRDLPFGKEIYIEKDDFKEDGNNKFFRLKPNGVVKLRGGYIIRCNEVIKNDSGEITELRCEYFPETADEIKFEGKKVKGVIHWVEASNAVDCEVRIYDRLFSTPDTKTILADDFKTHINPDSLKILTGCKAEKFVLSDFERFQFIRKGYFVKDNIDFTEEKPVFNKIMGLK